MGATSVAGIEATVTSTAAPAVPTGHVAAWIGVGGPGAGPSGADEWLQVGLSSLGGGSIRLYYEVVAPGAARRYVDLGAGVVGRPVRVGVFEVPAHPSSWRVWIAGRPVSPPLQLPASDQQLDPVATAESWRPSAAPAACNTFDYRFHRVQVVRRRGGPLSSFVTAWTLQRSPYTVVRRADGFVASSSPSE